MRTRVEKNQPSFSARRPDQQKRPVASLQLACTFCFTDRFNCNQTISPFSQEMPGAYEPESNNGLPDSFRRSLHHRGKHDPAS
jgi:hypothetical protein